LLTDFLEKVAWTPRDVLVIDFPPGTSDVPLSAMQFAQLDGVIIITSPGRTSLADAAKAVHMARKLAVPVLGLVINMEGDALGAVPDSFAQELGVPVIGRLPLDRTVREAMEQGKNPLALPIAESLARALLTLVAQTGTK
jgi:Mrp family chromosome partitioning ATPase